MIRFLPTVLAICLYSAAFPAAAGTIIYLCQNEDAELGVLTTHGNNSLPFMGSTTHVTGWERIAPGECFRDMPGAFRSREYAIAAKASDGRIIPLEITFERTRPIQHYLKTGQICVPSAISALDRMQLREGAQHLPCRQDETSFPSALFVVAGNANQNATFNIDISQADVDRLAGVAKPSLPPVGSAPGLVLNIFGDPSPTEEADDHAPEASSENAGIPDSDSWKTFVNNCMSGWSSTNTMPPLDSCICHEALYSAYGNQEMYEALIEDYQTAIRSHSLEELKDIMRFSRTRNDLCSFTDAGWIVPEHLKARRSEVSAN